MQYSVCGTSARKLSNGTGKELWLVFIDYEKVFDMVKHKAMWKALQNLGIPGRLVWLLERLYSKHTLRSGLETNQGRPSG